MTRAAVVAAVVAAPVVVGLAWLALATHRAHPEVAQPYAPASWTRTGFALLFGLPHPDYARDLETART